MHTTARPAARQSLDLHGNRTTIFGRAGTLAGSLLNLVFPPTCAFCLGEIRESTGLSEMAEAPLCHGCREWLFPAHESACERCGFPSAPGSPNTLEKNCPHCATKRFRFERAVAMGVYRGSLQTALLRMKHFRGQRLAGAVGRLMGLCLGDRLTTCRLDLVVPIPARRWRRMTTGSASPAILARRIARQLRIPVFPDVLRWQRNIKRQHTLLPSDRKRNVHGALAVTRGYQIGEAHVLVVDDILTTGATANEAARVLLKAGASRVTVAIVARVADR